MRRLEHRRELTVGFARVLFKLSRGTTLSALEWLTHLSPSNSTEKISEEEEEALC
jgi:hypothetical protein